VIYYVSKALQSITAIMVWVKEMTKGNLEQPLDKDRLSPAFTGFANNIERLQIGIKYAVSEAIKGERLKTELITNVSHDLKTPLTSIINYIDLLKKENLENETVNEYIGVLEEKSGRLKKLIEDLIEASKAASGDMRVNMEDVDLCSLVGQAVAEYNEKVLDAGLDVRVKHCEQPAVVKGDGTLVWRIMDNLLSNIVKYSQRNSRVYIDIEQTQTDGVITIKNISEMPLDISVDQLLERFVRGDSSRSTEGSGLGLSIAKSLSEIQGGKLELSIDGDLFKVIVSLPV
jgi:signal transduction histidine kinase